MSRARTITVLLLAVVIFSSCAHGAGTTAKSTSVSALDRIQQRGQLVVGTAGSMPPLNMTTKEGKVIGFEADLATFMASAMGVKPRFETMPFSDLLSALEQGRVDVVISGMTITPERNLRVAFVGPYMISGKAFLTKADNIASARNASEVNASDISLVALRGSTSQYFVESLIPKAKLLTAKDYDSAVDLVIQGKADAMVADYPICVVSIFRHPEEEFVSILTPFTHEPLGIALPAGDPHFANWTENFLGILKETGKLENLKRRWFEDGSWLSEIP